MHVPKYFHDCLHNLGNEHVWTSWGQCRSRDCSVIPQAAGLFGFERCNVTILIPLPSICSRTSVGGALIFFFCSFLALSLRPKGHQKLNTKYYAILYSISTDLCAPTYPLSVHFCS